MVVEKPVTTPSLRLLAAVNYFKYQLLGSEHVANDPQAALVRESVPKGPGLRGLDSRTWSSWFADRPPRPRPSALDCLDSWAARKGFGCAPGFRDNRHFYRVLVTQGLAHALLSPAASRDDEIAAQIRAAEYVPASALHLHLDCAEIASLDHGTNSVSSEKLQVLGAQRAMQFLHDRWNVRTGSIYASLSSDLAVQLSKSSEEEAADIRRFWDRFTPRAFDHLMKKAPFPVFCAFAEQRDLGPTQVHQTLLSIAGDGRFLQCDRMEAWCIDLASSCLALHALTWANGLAPSLKHVEPEIIYLTALQALLFDELDESELGELIGQVNLVGRFDWSADVYDTLVRARAQYHKLLHRYGLTARDVWAGAKRNKSLRLFEIRQ